jgi:uncharacterized protein YecT (DUF1311 family)
LARNLLEIAMRNAAFVMAAALLVAPAIASTDPGLSDPIMSWQDDPSVTCKNPQSTYDMNTCAGRDYKKSYTSLVAIYNQLYAKYDAANKKRLQIAQRSWRKYMDDECDYETAGTIGGTIHSTMVTNCNATLVEARIKQLQAQLNCAQGDMSCNAP